jgi:predicted nucleic acid-binding protein
MTIHTADNILENYQLNPRDELHIATAQFACAEYVISEDSDFNKFSLIQRKWLKI